MPIRDCLLTLPECAEYFKVSDQTVLNWVEKGMPKRSKGQYSLLDCTRWRLEQLSAELEIVKNSGDEKLHALKIEGQKISNRERAIKLRMLLGQLVDFESANIAWLDETTMIRKNLTAMIYKLASAVQGVTDQNKIIEIISREVRSVQNMIGHLKFDNNTSIDELEAELNEADDE